ncbi:MAG: alpha/beta hydrolase [Chloroflexaceae bacterium]|nr:alpha/beta hydrolase [Chloroflexaceae bacterium]
MTVWTTSNPIVLVGGWLSSAQDYLGLARLLSRPPHNRIVYIADISRREWFRMRDPDFRYVLNIVARTVDLALHETGSKRVDIIGHSAGGRIARAYLGDQPHLGVVYNGQRFVSSLITLGTPHTTWEVFVRQFGQFVNDAYPGAFYPHIAYRSVAGESVQGKRFGTPEEMFAHRSYELVINDGQSIGDGVSPTSSCYLPGAENLILPGVRHAPYNAPRRWYGAPAVMMQWFGDQNLPVELNLTDSTAIPG